MKAAITAPPAPTLPLPRAAALLRALVAPEPASLRRWLATEGLQKADARWLQAQGLAPYAFHQINQAGALDGLPPPLAASLQSSYQGGAVREALRHQEAVAALGALAGQGVEALLFKGIALADRVYPTPRCRPTGDLDLWIQPPERATAVAALEALGYQRFDHDDRPPALKHLHDGEQQMRSRQPGKNLVELQWPAFRSEWTRHTARVDHAAIWARRVHFDLAGLRVATLSPEDTLLHLCVHQAINHQFTYPCWTRSLLDVHLVVQQGVDWGAVVAQARAWRIATVAWTVLALAQGLAGTPVPAETLAALAPPFIQQRAIRALRLDRSVLEGWPSAWNHRRLLVQLALVDRPRDALRLLWRAVCPEREWIQARYGVETGGALWRARLLHPLRLLVSART